MTEEEFDSYTKELIMHLDVYIKSMYGTRCRQHEDGCAICDMWAVRDRLFHLTAFTPEVTND